MPESANRKQPLKPLSGVSRDDLKSLVEGLVEANPALADKINARVDLMRETTGQRLKAVSEIQLSVEQSELLKNLEAQYPAMKATLERRKIPTEGMPSFEQIKKGLTPEVLDKALKHKEPALLLIPPTTRKSKVEAIDKYPAKGQKRDTYLYKLDDNDLWNGGKSQTENKWRVKIDEGVQDVPQDYKIFACRRNNFLMSKLWVEKYAKEDLDVINDADEYLILMMKRLDEGQPIDPKTWCVINGKNMTKNSLVAYGNWGDIQVGLGYDDPDHGNIYLRLRGSVGVDVPMN